MRTHAGAGDRDNLVVRSPGHVPAGDQLRSRTHDVNQWPGVPADVIDDIQPNQQPHAPSKPKASCRIDGQFRLLARGAGSFRKDTATQQRQRLTEAPLLGKHRDSRQPVAENRVGKSR